MWPRRGLGSEQARSGHQPLGGWSGIFNPPRELPHEDRQPELPVPLRRT